MFLNKSAAAFKLNILYGCALVAVGSQAFL